MATSRANFHAGKAAAAFVASQRTSDLPPRTPAGHEADTLTLATVCDSIDVHNSCSGATLLEDNGRKVGYHSRRGLQPPTIGRGVDGQEPHVLANGSSQGSVGSFAPRTANGHETANRQGMLDTSGAATSPQMGIGPKGSDFSLKSVTIGPDTDTYEAARRQRAARLGCAIIPVDCELGRLAKLRLETRQYVVWCYAHIAADGEGRITRDDLFTALSELGITTNRRTFNRWIHDGNRLYWRERGGYLYLTSWSKLAARLTRWASKYHPDHVETNLPGQQRVQLDLTGSLQSVHANLYGGWITAKAQKHGYLDIARSTLSALWGASRQALLGYEKMLGIRTEDRYAESDDIHNPLIPAHAYLCLDTNGREYVSWQISNRYYPAKQLDIHPAKGQARKVRAGCHNAQSPNPAGIRRGGGFRVQRIGRIAFYGKYGKKGYVPAAKQLNHHLRKHGDVLDRPHYIYLTTRYGKRIYECSTGDCWRSMTAERDRAGEQSSNFQRRRMQYAIGWAGRIL